MILWPRQARTHRRLLAATSLVIVAAACGARQTPPPAPETAHPVVPDAAPPAPAALDSAASSSRRTRTASSAAPAQPDPFEGADFSPKPPVVAGSPSEEQAKFLLPPGYHMTPVLAEPAIQQPASIAFDGDGRMFVLELRSYMLDADAKNQLAPVSRISRWTDSKHDGVYDTHTVFVDSLVFPRFVTPYGANAILTMESNSNEVYKYTDTNGDGRADRRELFTGNFGRLANVEHLQSSLFWAMDNWLYSTVNAFRIRETKSGVIREPTGYNGAQWGASQDDDGKQWFQGGASGIPSYFQFPIAYGNFSPSDQYAPGFDDIWGAPMGTADMQGGMPFVRMPDGSLSKATAGSGSNVYRGGALPRDLIGDYFYGEVVGRVVRRVHPVDTEGLTQLHNIYQDAKSEFIRTTDPLFRPIEIKTAPDGSMYIVDMYHGVIQESQWTPKGSYLRAKIEQFQLDKLVGLGRIWRLTHDSAPRATPRPHMLSERPTQLVRHLENPNGWWRDMAQQLLVLRQDKSVVPALKRMAQRDTRLVARFHALWTLEGLGVLDRPFVQKQLADAQPRMRIQALRVSESLYKRGDTSFAASYRRLAKDTNADVAIQAMLTMNTLRVPDAVATVRAAVAANPARGVQFVGEQILDAPAEQSARTFAGRGLSPTQRAMMERGAATFNETCSQCHGETGLGKMLGNGQQVAPALAGSEHVVGHPDYVIRTLLHGLSGPIAGRSYAGQIMVSQAQQSDEWIASIASYIRNTMTNQASFVSPEQVAAIRARYAGKTTTWTYPELASTVPSIMYVQSTWKATASHNSENAYRAFTTSGWSSVAPQQAGMWFQFELPAPVTLAELQFQYGGASGWGRTQGASGSAQPVVAPRAFRVQVSNDGTQWSAPIAEMQSTGANTVIDFTPVKTRFVRITQTATADSAPWSIQQLQLLVLRPH